MPTVVRFDCYEVDFAAGQLLKRGAKIQLRDQSFQVLAALVARPGQVVTREELRQRLWPDNVFVDFDNNLNSAIARLREVLNDSAERPRFIETLPRHGYRFVGAISEPALAPAPSAGDKRTRLLVLPFVNSSGDAEQEYFSDAVTDEIITELAGLRSDKLAVLARTTSMQLKRTRKDVVRIGRELAVDFVVEGAVRRHDDQIAITVQLIRTSDCTHVFARRYETALYGLCRVEEQISRDIADALGVAAEVSLRMPVAHSGGKRRPTDLAAYTAYIKGRHYLDQFTPEAISKAKALFEEAIRREPSCALPYDSLAELCWKTGLVGYAPPKDACLAGLFYALKAIEIDNTLAETHAMIGQYRAFDFDWAEVHREMSRALALDPHSPTVRLRYAITGLMPQGRLDEAIAEIQQSLELDPLSMYTRHWLVLMFWLARDYERGLEEGRALVESESFRSGHLVIGQTLCMAGRYEEAITNLRAQLTTLDSPVNRGWLGLALAMGGKTGEARALLEQLRTAARQAYMPPTSLAWIHFGLGEIDEAFIWMDKAIDARDYIIYPLKTYPFLDPIRDDPRFRALLKKMNLEP